MIVQCRVCKKRLKVPSGTTGRKVGCSACRATINLPAEAPASDPGPASTAVELFAATDPVAAAVETTPQRAVTTPVRPKKTTADNYEHGDTDPSDKRAWIDRFVSAGLALLLSRPSCSSSLAVFSGSREMAGGDGVTVALGQLDSETLTDTTTADLKSASAGGVERRPDAAAELATNVESPSPRPRPIRATASTCP